MSTIALRAATVGDLEFIFELHKATLGPYVDQVWGWDDDDQRAYLDRTIDIATTQIIVVDGVDAGRLNLADQDGDVYIGLIEVDTDFQRQGIGTRILRDVLNDAFNAGRGVRLSVLKVNSDASRLYQRLGFVEHRADEGAETDVRVHMRVHPPAQSPIPVRGVHSPAEPAWQLRAATPHDRGFVVEMARHACVIEDRPLPDPDDDEVLEMLPAAGAVAIIAQDRQGHRWGRCGCITAARRCVSMRLGRRYLNCASRSPHSIAAPASEGCCWRRCSPSLRSRSPRCAPTSMFVTPPAASTNAKASARSATATGRWASR